MKVLALDSNSDELTQRASEYRKQHVYPYMEMKGHAVTRFDAIPPPKLRGLISVEAQRPGLKYMTGAGHGLEEKAFTGNSQDELYSVGNFETVEVTGKIVHFLSCGIGGTLGAEMVDKGCLAFFGYQENFAFFAEAADIFFECDSEIDRAFADGETARDVYDRAVRLFDRRIEELRSQQKFFLASWLRFNRNNLCAPSLDEERWGDPDAKLV